jgi:hypothetical protein
MRDESGLHRMELIATRDALDREHIGAVMTYREGQAGVDAAAIDQHGTGAALAAVASFLAAGQIETLTQQVEQRDAGVFQLDVPPDAVDGKADGEAHAGSDQCYGQMEARPPRLIGGRL